MQPAAWSLAPIKNGAILSLRTVLNRRGSFEVLQPVRVVVLSGQLLEFWKHLMVTSKWSSSDLAWYIDYQYCYFHRSSFHSHRNWIRLWHLVIWSCKSSTLDCISFVAVLLCKHPLASCLWLSSLDFDAGAQSSPSSQSLGLACLDKLLCTYPRVSNGIFFSLFFSFIQQLSSCRSSPGMLWKTASPLPRKCCSTVGSLDRQSFCKKRLSNLMWACVAASNAWTSDLRENFAHKTT